MERSPRYTRTQTVEQVKKELEKSPEQFYKATCLNWTGKVIDGGDYYSEVIAEYLLKDMLRQFKKIRVITRNKSYKTNHADTGQMASNRHEEKFAKKLKEETLFLKGLGQFIDYQMPLKNKRVDKAGKVDLVSYDVVEPSVYLIELKFGKNEESLIRAVLEIYTYHCMLNRKKLLHDFKLHETTNLKKAVLLTDNTQAFKEGNDLSKRSNLRKLIIMLGVQIFSIDSDCQRCKEIIFH